MPLDLSLVQMELKEEVSKVSSRQKSVQILWLMLAASWLMLAALGSLVFAQEKAGDPLTFQSWKDQQVLEAQNQVLRTSSRMEQAKIGKGGTKEITNRAKKTAAVDSTAAVEKDHRRAQESLETAQALQFEDYINIYLPTLQDQPDTLAKLAEKLSKEELAEIFKSLVKRGSKPSDTKRSNSALMDGLASTAHSKGL